MDIVELIDHYRYLLKSHGRERADRELRDMGVARVVARDVAWAFRDDGSRRRAAGRP